VLDPATAHVPSLIARVTSAGNRKSGPWWLHSSHAGTSHGTCTSHAQPRSLISAVTSPLCHNFFHAKGNPKAWDDGRIATLASLRLLYRSEATIFAGITQWGPTPSRSIPFSVQAKACRSWIGHLWRQEMQIDAEREVLIRVFSLLLLATVD